MSDYSMGRSKSKPEPEGGSDWEMKQAEKQIESLANSPELAVAFRRHGEGVRNLIQGELGQSFINSLERVISNKLTPIEELLRTALEDNATRLGKNEKDIAMVSDRVETLEERADQQAAREQVRDDHIVLLDRDMQAVKARMTEVEARQDTLQHEHRQLVTHLKRDAHLLKIISEESGGVE